MKRFHLKLKYRVTGSLYPSLPNSCVWRVVRSSRHFSRGDCRTSNTGSQKYDPKGGVRRGRGVRYINLKSKPSRPGILLGFTTKDFFTTVWGLEPSNRDFFRQKSLKWLSERKLPSLFKTPPKNSGHWTSETTGPLSPFFPFSFQTVGLLHTKYLLRVLVFNHRHELDLRLLYGGKLGSDYRLCVGRHIISVGSVGRGRYLL